MTKNRYINVWDLLVRIFHWSLVFLVFTAFLTGDEESLIHRYAGYVVVAFIIIRFIWGFIGSKYARFRDFVSPPSRAIQYLKELFLGSPRYYIGHNPAAGWMVLLLLSMLLVVCGTGYLAYQAKDHSPSAHENYNLFVIVKYAYADRSDDDHKGHGKEDGIWKEIHEGASSILLTLILIHIAGALASSLAHRENLVKSMITGKKEKKT